MYEYFHIINIVLFKMKCSVLGKIMLLCFWWVTLWLVDLMIAFQKAQKMGSSSRIKTTIPSLIKPFNYKNSPLSFSFLFSLWTLNTNPNPRKLQPCIMSSGSKRSTFNPTIPKIETTTILTKNKATIHIEHFFDINYLEGISLKI